tara:strand:+ start:476 stop:988 length:513 start_codon:yes stop_codon:yes gene_type:complete
MTEDIGNSLSVNKLWDKWVLWTHLPHDTSWSLDSYKSVMSFDTVESAITLTEYLPDKMIINCMLFIMREGIKPTWEDERNRKGGSFSYKVPNKNAPSVWRDLTYSLVGETLSSNNELQKNINGITISPKKNFCIIKIWTADSNIKKADSIININGLSNSSSIFKKHNPEY